MSGPNNNFYRDEPLYTTSSFRLSGNGSKYRVQNDFDSNYNYTTYDESSISIDGTSYTTFKYYRALKNSSQARTEAYPGKYILLIYRGTGSNDQSLAEDNETYRQNANQTLIDIFNVSTGYATDIYYIKNSNGSAISPDFGNVEIENCRYIQIGDYIYPYILETPITFKNYEVKNETSPNKTSFDPFEPIDLEGASLTIETESRIISSAKIGEVNKETETYDPQLIHSLAGMPGSLTEPGEYRYTVWFCNWSMSRTYTLTCNDWASKEYYIDKSGIASGDYSIKPTQELPEEFFGDYSLYFKKTSNYENKSTIVVRQTSLEKDRITPAVMPEGELTFDFDYDITGLTETEQTIVHYTITTNIDLGENFYVYKDFTITKQPSKKDYFVNLSIDDQPKYDFDNPGFDFSDIEATIVKETYLNNVYQNSETINLGFNDLIITHQRITASGNCLCTVTYNADGNSKTANFSINITLLKYILEVEGNIDSETYWGNYDENRFHYPTGVFKALKYNDSSLVTKTYGSSDFNESSFSYYLDASCTQAIRFNEIFSNQIETFYYVLQKDTSIRGSYNIQYITDSITNLEIANSVDFILGNELLKSAFKIKATYSSGKTEDNFVNYKFCDSEGNAFSGLVLSERDIYIKDNLTTQKVYKIEKENINWCQPAINKVEISLNGTSLSYNNKVDSIDLRKMTATVSYVDSSYTQKLEFQASNVLTDDKHFYFSSDDSYFNSYDFSNPTPINYIMPTGNASLHVPIKLNLLNRFSEEPFNEQITLNIIDILDIVGISLLSMTTEYAVGDTFLNENDETKIRLLYDDVTGERRQMDINLRDGNSALNIYPPKGTVFNYSDRSIDVTVSAATNYNIQVKYNISVSTKYKYTNTQTHTLKPLLVSGEVLDPNGEAIETNYSTEKNGVYMLVSRNDPKDAQYSYDEDAEYTYFGYLDDLFDETKSAKMILFKDYVSPIDGDNNITVLYPCYVASNADKVNKCHFGILFGSNNAMNRLFVSGNPDSPNADWHSSAINNTNVEGERMKDSGNFSFISDLSVMYYGETDNKIIGYDIVSNDKLLVLKNKSDKETTVYFRTPALVTALDSSGAVMTDVNNQTLYQEEFSLVKGNNATAGVNPRAITNFNGDTVFIDAENHLVGLDLVGIIGDTQRYANSRSSYIDNRIKLFDLSESFLWTNNKYLFFPIKDYGTFITHYKTLTDGQYEWWYLTDKNPTVFLDYNNEVYFGNDEGNFYKIQKDSFADRNKLYIDNKNSILAGIDPLENEVIVSYEIIKSLDLDKQYKFKISTSDDLRKAIFSKIGKASNSGNPDFRIMKPENCDEPLLVLNNNDKAYSILLEKDIYLDYAPNYNQILQTSTVYSTYTPYRLERVEVDGEYNDCYRILRKDLNGDWVPTDLSKLTEAVLCYKLDGEYSIVNIDKENSSFQLAEGDEIIDVERYADQNLSSEYTGEIIHETNVEAFYITAPFTMGSLQSFKTIWSYTLTNDTDIPSELELSYASNKLPNKKTKTLAAYATADTYTLVSKDAFGVDFDELDFRKIDFDKTIVPRAYTMQRILPLQKFICFCFRNTNQTNSVLSTLNITYTIPYPSYGSD